jgi:D-amino-acid dehydrogenase
MPSSTPGLVKRIPKMLMDPQSPLVLRWQYVPRLLPWLAGYLANSARDRVERNCLATAQLFRHVMSAYDMVIRETGCGELIQPTGSLKLFESEASFQGSAFERQMMDRCGCRYEVLGVDEIRQMEPNLAPIFVRALFIPDSRNILNPGRLVETVARAVAAKGGILQREKVAAVEIGADGKPAVVTDKGRHGVDAVVLAAGARSGQLARQLGAKIVLDGERGYHIMLPRPEKSIKRYLQFAESRISLSPKEGGLRMTSIVELASVDAPPDYRRIRRLTAQAARVLPGLTPEEKSIWMGSRPSLPDNVPVIARSPRHDRVYFAFGHSHLGMTMGPVTGRVIADLVAGRDPGLDMTPYRAVRPLL